MDMNNNVGLVRNRREKSGEANDTGSRVVSRIPHGLSGHARDWKNANFAGNVWL